MMVISSKSYNQLDRTYNFLKKKGVTEVIMQPIFLDKTDKYNLDLKTLSKPEFIKLFKNLERLMTKEKKKRYFNLLKKMYIKNKIDPVSCFMNKHKIVIDQKGDIYPCFHISKKLGSIFYWF